MRREVVISGYCDKQGRFSHESTLLRVLRAFPPDTKLRVTVSKAKMVRTLSQNAYYWGVVLPILGEHFGYSTDDIHTEMKRKFNPIPSKIIEGVSIGGSTRAMKTDEFSEYVDSIKTWALVDHGIIIPEPSDV